jgi:hypothetical protein
MFVPSLSWCNVRFTTSMAQTDRVSLTAQPNGIASQANELAIRDGCALCTLDHHRTATVDAPVSCPCVTRRLSSVFPSHVSLACLFVCLFVCPEPVLANDRFSIE